MTIRINQNGFTLVELAIVMVVIGLLIGGILKGAELVSSARINRTITDIKSFETAIETYRDRYDAVPGDHVNAREVLTGCSPANFCTNGNGNSRIGSGNYTWQTRFSSADAQDAETFQVWKHLAMTDMITGIQTNADPSAPALGQTHPYASIGGGFEIYYDNFMTVGGQGTQIRISGNGVNGTGTVVGAASTNNVAFIDRKLDDGAPNTGSMLASYGSNTQTGCKVTRNSQVVYDESNGTNTCVIYIRILR